MKIEKLYSECKDYIWSGVIHLLKFEPFEWDILIGAFIFVRFCVINIHIENYLLFVKRFQFLYYRAYTYSRKKEI